MFKIVKSHFFCCGWLLLMLIERILNQYTKWAAKLPPKFWSLYSLAQEIFLNLFRNSYAFPGLLLSVWLFCPQFYCTAKHVILGFFF